MLSLAAVLMALSACSSSTLSVSGGQTTSQTETKGLTAGNWYFSATSQNVTQNGSSMGQFFSGPLAVSSGVVSLTTAPISSCLPDGLSVFSGTVSGNSVTISSPPISGSSKALTMTGTAYNGSNFDGLYQLTGATASDICYGDAGTVYGILISPISGTWSSSIVEQEYSDYSSTINYPGTTIGITNTAYVFANITQDAIPVIISTTYSGTISAYPLSGTVTFYNSLCFSSGTIDPTQSYLSGRFPHLVIKTNTGDTITPNLTMNPTKQNLMTLNYTVPPNSSVCPYYQVQNATLQTPGIQYSPVQ
jgi:hypothetical protein